MNRRRSLSKLRFIVILKKIQVMRKIATLFLALVMGIGAMAQVSGLRLDGSVKKDLNAYMDKIVSLNENKTKTDPAVTITMGEIGALEAEVTFTPSADVVKYYYYAGEAGELEYYMEYFEMFGMTVSLEEIIVMFAMDSATAELTTTVEGLIPNSTNRVYVAATLSDQTVSSVTEDFTTGVLGGDGEAVVETVVSNIQRNSVDITMTPNDQSAYYYYIVFEDAQFEQMEYTEDSVISYLELEDFKEYSQVSGTMSDLTPNTDYTIYTLAYNANNERSELQATPFTTLQQGGEGEATVAITTSNITASSFDVTFAPNDQTAYYYYLIADDEFMASENMTTDEDVVAYLMEEDWKEYDTISGTVGNLQFGTEYKIYAVAYNVNGEQGAFAPVTVTTLSLGGDGEAVVNIEVSNITETSFDVAFTPNDQTAYYYYLIASAQDLENNGLTTNDAILDYLENYGGEKIYEQLEGPVTELESGTLYKIYTFAYNGNMELGPVGYQEVTTEHDVSLSDVEISMFKLYPNPANDVVNISAAKKISRVELCNILGQTVKSKEVDAKETKMDVSGMTKGVYFIRVYSDNKVATKKLVVE